MPAEATDRKHPVDIRIGRAIHLRRRAAEITRHDLADRAGVTELAIENYEYGLHPVPPQALYAIAEVLGCRPIALAAGMPESDAAGEETERQYAVVEVLQHFAAMTPHRQQLFLELATEMAADAANAAARS